MADSAVSRTAIESETVPETFLGKLRRTLASPLHLREIGVLAALILIGVFLSTATPYFLTTTNLLNISRQMVIISIIAVGRCG